MPLCPNVFDVGTYILVCKHHRQYGWFCRCLWWSKRNRPCWIVVHLTKIVTRYYCCYQFIFRLSRNIWEVGGEEHRTNSVDDLSPARALLRNRAKMTNEVSPLKGVICPLATTDQLADASRSQKRERHSFILLEALSRAPDRLFSLPLDYPSSIRFLRNCFVRKFRSSDTNRSLSPRRHAEGKLILDGPNGSQFKCFSLNLDHRHHLATTVHYRRLTFATVCQKYPRPTCHYPLRLLPLPLNLLGGSSFWRYVWCPFCLDPPPTPPHLSGFGFVPF